MSRSKFKFSLETVLRLRRLDQQQALRAVNEVLHAVDVLDDRIRAAAEERATSRRFGQQGIGPIQVNQLLDAGRYDIQLEAMLRELDNQREQLLAEVERRREALRSADQLVKQMERLRESALDRHRESVRIREQKELDEIAVQLHQARHQRD